MRGKKYVKLSPSFQMVTVDGKQYLTSTVRGFSGQMACNETAAFLIGLLRRRTTEDKLIRKMCRTFDAPQDEIASDVADILQMLRRIGALEE